MNQHSQPAGFPSGRPAIAADGEPGAAPATAFFSPAALAVAWLVLVGLAVVGRSWQPAAHVTPLAGVSLVAGVIFPSMLVAASVPLVATMIGNLYLPSYGSVALAAVVYAALAWPVVLGRLGLLGRPGERPRWLAITGGALASSLVFFFATNAAHWAITDQYPHTPSGLLACLAAGLPFHRWMPLGDVAWSLALFAGLAWVTSTGGLPAGSRLVTARLPRGRGDASA